jgi:hypothetical protein
MLTAVVEWTSEESAKRMTSQPTARPQKKKRGEKKHDSTILVGGRSREQCRPCVHLGASLVVLLLAQSFRKTLPSQRTACLGDGQEAQAVANDLAQPDEAQPEQLFTQQSDAQELAAVD